MSVQAKNPILPGFYPDPSICAVGDDFYIVNSSFAYFPGLPIMHSKDLAHWEQIGNVLTTKEQLPLKEAYVSQGLFAPTIRYNKGTFYVICTNVSFGGNFIVTATNPEGPWSEPHYIEGAEGIDPSLFFDENGKCYYIGTHPNPEGCKYDGDWYIYIQELDIKNFRLVGEKKDVWNGAMRGVHWPEGPHLYKIGEYYYILHAEGGTGPEHAVSVARSKDVFGPYEGNFCNPILTHRHLGQKFPVRYVGHADLFQTKKGDWYMIMLAVRQIDGYTTIGRETFMARVIWENGWPVVNPNVGHLTPGLVIDLDPWETEYSQNYLPGVDKNYDFRTMSKLGPEFLALRNPDDDMYKFDQAGLRLKCAKEPVTGLGNISYLALRQDCHAVEFAASLHTDNLNAGAAAGIMVMQNSGYHLRFEVSNWIGYLILCRKGVEEKLATIALKDTSATIIIRINGLKASAFVVEERKIKPIAMGLDISALSTEVAGGFVGCTVGMFATDAEESREEPVYAAFRSFSYKRLTADVQKEEEA